MVIVCICVRQCPAGGLSAVWYSVEDCGYFCCCPSSFGFLCRQFDSIIVPLVITIPGHYW